MTGFVSNWLRHAFATTVKSHDRNDDVVDVFGGHDTAGGAGTMLPGNPAGLRFGRPGLFDVANAGLELRISDMGLQLVAQINACGLTLPWSCLVPAQLFKAVDVVIGLRPDEDRGLDNVDRCGSAYNLRCTWTN